MYIIFPNLSIQFLSLLRHPFLVLYSYTLDLHQFSPLSSYHIAFYLFLFASPKAIFLVNLIFKSTPHKFSLISIFSLNYFFLLHFLQLFSILVHQYIFDILTNFFQALLLFIYCSINFCQHFQNSELMFELFLHFLIFDSIFTIMNVKDPF